MGSFGHYLAAHFDTLRLEFWSLFVGGVANGFLYGMVAVGYTLVYGVLRLINFAHSEIFMSGGFASYFVMKALIGTSVPSGVATVGLIVIGIVAIIITVISNLVIYFRPTSLLETVLMLGLIFGGLGLVLRSLRPHEA